MPDPADLTATEAARAIRDGRLVPAELAEACLARIAERDRTVRAMSFIDPNLVRNIVSRVAAGPLHGLPIGVKDVLDTADMPSEYGSPIWRGHRPRADASAVAWARAAGGVMIGKTVTTEFAVRTPGPTTHPLDPQRTPGGSSSGSAAGVAARFFPLAFATQTAGSIIRPAAFCGVVGYKPSFGMLPRLGMKLMAESLDTIGVMARSVADCALFIGSVARRDLGDPDKRPDRAPRIAVCRSPSWSHAAPETMALLERLPGVLSRAGAAVEERELPQSFSAIVRAHPVVQHAEGAQSMGWELAHHRSEISTTLRDLLERGLATEGTALDAARATLRAGRAALPMAMEGLDILLTPSAPGEAPLGLGSTGSAAFNFLWTSLHVPCVTVPAGVGPAGLPLGIQIVGRQDDDHATLAWAQWVASALS
ncbi:MAG: amidase [Alphaproteobacteria bacterium]|nr:amidase [Alphaproteobacteria bacterium]